MDQGHHHVSISPLFVGLLGVISGAIIVATFHCILVACCNSQSETSPPPPSQPPRVYRRTLANTPMESYNPTSTSSNASSSNNTSASTSTSMSASMMHSLDVHKFSKEFKEGTCAVCLGEFQDDEDIRILPECAHVFHVSCIDVWLYSQANCPLCRAVTTPRGHRVVVAFPESESVGVIA